MELNKNMPKRIMVIGTRGIPGGHGGFETFAQRLALFLVAADWKVTVYCQGEEKNRPEPEFNQWEGVDLVTIHVGRSGSLGSVLFDWRCISHVRMQNSDDPVLVLGYNTALFLGALSLSNNPLVINMDGIEWKRGKWHALAKAWLWINEWAGLRLADQLIADHPEIRNHLLRRIAGKEIFVIPYGGDWIETSNPSILVPYGLKRGGYIIVIARPEPENSILEVVRAFSRRRRDVRLVVLGRFEDRHNRYHAKVIASASEEVLFPGAIYDRETVDQLRKNALLYVHGHTVGGTNPSLVEAIGAGRPILAHDNPFNRWVLGDVADYFQSEEEIAKRFDDLHMNAERLAEIERQSRHLIVSRFSWDEILNRYRGILENCHHRAATSRRNH